VGGPASRQKFVIGIVFFGASRWPPQNIIRSPDMPLTDQQREALLTALLSHGWRWRDGSIYAPHGTMWLLGVDPWAGDLRDFDERMKGRLLRNEMARCMYEREGDHEKLVSDTRSLVKALADLPSTPN
jgi:hypothetical protein